MKKSAKPTDTRPAGLDAKSHTELFGAAMKTFTAGDYVRAKEMFDEASSGPQIGVNESAQMYARMCEQRLQRLAPRLESPDDHYDYSITLLNAGRYSDARNHLEQAVAAKPAAHFLYALSLAEGMLQAFDAAAAHLRRAIEADPSIRGSARSDPDFHPLLQNPLIREVLHRDGPAV